MTGERTVPGITRENYWFRRHEAAYEWVVGAVPVSGAVVVEAGAGEGYGADLLRASGASTVIALEYDAAAAEHCASTYPGTAVVRANLAGMPLRAGCADLVVSLQVVEHLWDLAGFLRACARTLRPGGTLVLSTPNRLTFSPGLSRGARPTNPFHVEEFDARQLADLVGAAGFTDVRLVGLGHGPRLSTEDAAFGSVVDAQVRAVLDDAWDDTLIARVAEVSIEDFVISPAEVEASLDLIVRAERP